MSASLPKLAAPIAPLLPRLELDAEGAALLDGATDAASGIERLVAAGRMPEAVRLTAHALPKREAVWWACMCARAVPDPALLRHRRVGAAQDGEEKGHRGLSLSEPSGSPRRSRRHARSCHRGAPPACPRSAR